MGVQGDGRLAWYHGRNPDHPGPLLLQTRHCLLELPRHVGGIGGASAQHHLGVRGQIRDRIQQMAQALLPRHAAHADHVRAHRIDAIGGEAGRVGVRGIGLGVNAVRNHRDGGRVAVEEPGDIGCGALRHGYNAIRHLQGRFLDPCREVIAAPELLPLPGAQRFQGMHSHDEWQPIEDLREDPSEVGVPGMTMHHVSLEALAGKGQAGAQSYEGRGEARRAGDERRTVWLKAAHP